MPRCRRIRRIVSSIGLLVTCAIAAGCDSAATQAPPPAAAAPASSTASLASAPGADLPSFVSADLYRLQSVGDVQLSPDGTRVAYTVQLADRPGRPYTQLWIADVASGRLTRIGSKEGSTPRWSPDSQQLAYVGDTPDGASGLVVSRADGSNPFLLAPLSGTNAPLPSSGDRIDVVARRKADRVHVLDAGARRQPNGDPMVITRYLYKPPASYPSRWNDNRRLHIFVADVATRQIRQLTDGTLLRTLDRLVAERRRSWRSSRIANPIRIACFNYDLFAIEPRDTHDRAADQDQERRVSARSGLPTARPGVSGNDAHADVL